MQEEPNVKVGGKTPDSLYKSVLPEVPGPSPVFCGRLYGMEGYRVFHNHRAMQTRLHKSVNTVTVWYWGLACVPQSPGNAD